MKHMQLKKVAAAALAGSMILSCASCALFGANKKEIIEAADTFAGALVKQDAGKIVKLTNEKKNSETAESLEILFNKDMYSADQYEFIKAVGDTLAYEIDESSVEADKEEASVDVVFTMVDYEKALKDDYSDIDEVKDLLDDCEDTKEVTVTVEFEKDDDEWLVSNLKSKDYGKLFDFYSYELDLVPDLASLIDYTDCWGGAYYIYSDVYFTEDISDYAGMIFFDVYCDGALISSGNEASVYGTYMYCDYYDPDYNDLPSGEYSIVVTVDGAEIVTMTTELEAYETTPTTTGYDNSLNYNVYAEGELADLVVATDWWNDDDYAEYDSSNGFFEFDIYFTDELTYEDVQGMTFAFYDSDMNPLVEDQTIADDKTNTDQGYTDSNGYYFIYCGYAWPNGEIDSGFYYVEVFNPDGSTLYFDTCYVD